jgi:hypothetical protein
VGRPFLGVARAQTRPNRFRIATPAFGNTVFVVFALVQMGDGFLTYLGMTNLGPGIEGNPLIAWYAAAFGEGTALLGAKAFAIFCAMVLHINGRTPA